MTGDKVIQANQVFLSWCKKNTSRIHRATTEHLREFYSVDRSLKAETKFWAGAREHKTDFTKMSNEELDKMIEDEIIDLMFYVGLKVSRRKVPPSAFKS